MTKNKTNRIPNFKTKKAEALFWDNHDFTDFLSQTKKVKLKVNLHAPKNEVLTIRLQPQLKQQMNRLATEMGTQTSTYLPKSSSIFISLLYLLTLSPLVGPTLI
ncbi:hypothetical protein DRH14_01755 [Candidatus Shapirobacteria bacterium]|nr:MAG: hypothetical protein DRH14_01755 [Candidatus Shapirobacteria bacterium]